MFKLLKIIILLISFTLLTSTLTSTYAQEDVKEELSAIENERNDRIEQALLLNLAEISDNPNHIITFKDPSGEGVSLEIDGQGFEEIRSPYTLPSLSLGKHILTFKFTDEQDTEQILERGFTIIPRPPIINPPSVIENEIRISGTAMANSKVEVFLSREIQNQKELVEVDQNGEWEQVFSENIDEGVYTVIGTTRRNGFSSYYSEPIVFTVGKDKEAITPIQQQEGISFSFNDLNLNDYRGLLQILKNNTDLLITLGIFFFLGFLFTLILTSLIGRFSQRKSKKVLQDLLKKKTILEGSSLKEKFEISKSKKDEDIEEKIMDDIEEVLEEEHIEEKVVKKLEEDEKTEEEEEVKEEKKKKPTKKKNTKKEKKLEDEEETKSLTKQEFLEKFKDFDPDDDEGEEKKLKKNIKISLTSKD